MPGLILFSPTDQDGNISVTDQEVLGAPLITDTVTGRFTSPATWPLPEIRETHYFRLLPGQTVYLFRDQFITPVTDGELYTAEQTLRVAGGQDDPNVSYVANLFLTQQFIIDTEVLTRHPIDYPPSNPVIPGFPNGAYPIEAYTAPSTPGTYYLILQGEDVESFPPSVPDQPGGRFLITTTLDNNYQVRVDAWGEDWLQRAPEGLFTENPDSVDFNNLTPDQVDKIEALLDDPGTLDDKLYFADAGDDEVHLPEADKLQLSQNVAFDFTKFFDGERGNDTIFGSLAADKVRGGEDQDSLEGRSGDDILVGGDGNDTLKGGDNNDVLAANDNFDVTNVDGDPGTLAGVLVGIEFPGSPVAGAETNLLDGEDGRDLLIGYAGNDTLIGGSGRDKLYGGSGDDTLYGGSRPDPNVNYEDDRNPDFLFGGSGNNQIFAGEGDTVYFFGEGPEYTVEINSGSELFSFAQVKKGNETDTISLLHETTVFEFGGGLLGEESEATWDELLGVIRDRDRIQDLVEQVKQTIDELVDVQTAIAKIDELEAQIDTADRTLVRETMLAIVSAVPILQSADDLYLAKRIQETIGKAGMTAVNAAESTIKLAAIDGDKLYKADRDATDLLLFGSSVVAIAVSIVNPPLGLALSVTIAGMTAANAGFDWRAEVNAILPELNALRAKLQENLVDEAKLEVLLDGLVQQLMDKTGLEKGWPAVRFTDDQWSTPDIKPTLDQAIEALGGTSAVNNFNLLKGANVAGTGDGEVLIDVAGAQAIDTQGGHDFVALQTPAGEVLLGEGNDTLMAVPGFASADGGPGDDQLEIFADPSAPGALFQQGPVVQNFETVSVKIDLLGTGQTETLEFTGAAAQFGDGSNNTLDGSAGANLMSGGAGNDVLNGQAGNDLLEGGAGSDDLQGGAGQDRLAGGAGNDSLTGGAEGDVFVAMPDGSADTVQDFQPGLDLIDLRSFSAQTAVDAIQNAQAGSVILTFPDGTVLHIMGANIADFGLQDVILSNADPEGAPQVTGQALEGETLEADLSGLDDPDGIDNTSIAYQWRRDGAPISGATNNTYLLTQADVGAQMSVLISYTDTFGTLESVASTPTEAIQNANNDPSGTVIITGAAELGQTLTADASGVTDEDGIDAASAGYQWQRNGLYIPGATASTYTLTQADVGTTITVVYSYTDTFNTLESVTSAATAQVATPGRLLTGTPAPDFLVGTRGSDTIEALASNDTVAGGAGNDTLDGGGGIDTAVYFGDQSS
ncbi:hypothetical protein ACROHD_20145, partial [Nioella aestuarii]